MFYPLHIERDRLIRAKEHKKHFFTLMRKKHEAMEDLFVCAQSASANSIVLIDPFSGSTRWSLRDTELQQQGIIQTAEPLGSHPSFLCVALADKLSLHFVPLTRVPKKVDAHNQSLHSVKSLLAHKANLIQTHPCGDFIFVSAGNKLLTWEVHLGQLLSLVEEHLRDISAMRISSCGHFLVTASLDGDVKVFMTANLVAEHEPGLSVPVSAFVSYSPHTLCITDLFLSGGANSVGALRILSVSSDYSAVLYSLSTKQVLLRITADRPITACCMDPAELRIFLAAESGPICSLDICTQFADQNLRLTAHNSAISPASASSFICRFDHQHNASVLKLTMSADGTRLGSGDAKGTYCMWDIANGQCLLSGTMNGPISALSFCRHWQIVDDQSKGDNNRKVTFVTTLQRNLMAKRSLKMVKHWEKENNSGSNEEAAKSVGELLGTLVKRINNGERILAPCYDERNEFNEKKEFPELYKRQRLSKLNVVQAKRKMMKSGKNGETACSVTNNEMMSERELMLTEQVLRLQRELARVVQLNAELYSYSAKMVLEDGRPEK